MHWRSRLRFPTGLSICTTGDGSFGFALQELDTARRYGLPVIFVIHNNAAWGIIQVGQHKAGFELETDLSGRLPSSGNGSLRH
ncbi:thiamine pyrophosphate-dependent acetolactate synthase large subunit-like protein [Devosia subaequoris]|uniref:Thiamine pyrophosphate-dependent acetolactate synthase large subunit-like protein n=1 Tax=Devosia subaequoris TaxID=395930 RepID=A0A7W6IPS1_9HYPH|nr:thiamine pyrophosphate-dependent enzyme [Devosia subaequoris]MBB4052870.1 thiamine pyrophosphate-dependent acetolactate synthase large subunit-like protein [Devosia subaequoris]MCP1210021.1 thiamine pyrophosphate-dependent enzyme [Devosia subaequoris]